MNWAFKLESPVIHILVSQTIWPHLQPLNSLWKRIQIRVPLPKKANSSTLALQLITQKQWSRNRAKSTRLRKRYSSGNWRDGTCFLGQAKRLRLRNLSPWGLISMRMSTLWNTGSSNYQILRWTCKKFGSYAMVQACFCLTLLTMAKKSAWKCIHLCIWVTWKSGWPPESISVCACRRNLEDKNASGSQTKLRFQKIQLTRCRSRSTWNL